MIRKTRAAGLFALAILITWECVRSEQRSGGRSLAVEDLRKGR